MKQLYLPIASCLFMLFSYGQDNLNKFKVSSATRPTETNAAATNAQNNVGFFEVRLTSATKRYKTEFYFNDVSTYGLDRGYDAAVFGSGAPQFAIYSKLMEPGIYADVDFAIQSLPYTCLTTQVIIPISVNLKKGLSGSIHISDSYLEPGTEIYLEDTDTNTFTLITNTSHNFTAHTALNGEGRFRLHIGSNTTLSDQQEALTQLKIITSKNQKTITVKGQLTEKTELSLMDLQGHLVSRQTMDNTNQVNVLDVNQINPGVYVVVLKNNTSQKSQKVIIN